MSGRRARWVEAGLILGLALAVRLIGLDHTPHTDELNHMLAGRSFRADGTFEIGNGGRYPRAKLMTVLVAAMNAVFGEGLVVARIPALVTGVLLVGAVFLWTRAVAGRLAAWIAAVLLITNPMAVYLSQTVRFYSLQVLLIWVGVTGWYGWVMGRMGGGGNEGGGASEDGMSSAPGRAGGRAGGRALIWPAIALAIALHLQLLTLVDGMGLGLWTALVMIPRGAGATKERRGERGERRRPGALAMAGGIALAAIGVALLAVFAKTGPGGYLVKLFHFVPLHAAGHTHNPWFYVQYLRYDYGVLWLLFPLWLALALAFRPRPALFCGILFGTAMVFHAIAAWKHERYLFHALPFLFVVMGIAAGGILERAGAALGWGRVGGARKGSLGWVAAAVGLVVATALSTNAFRTTWKMLTVSDERWDDMYRYRGEPDWAKAAPALRAVADSVEVVVSSNDLKSLYYLDRMDYTLSAFNLTSVKGNLPEFGIAEKTGMPVISDPGSIAKVIDSHQSGLVVVERYDWHERAGVPGGTGNYISAHTEAVPLDGHWRLLAFRWRRPGGTPVAQ